MTSPEHEPEATASSPDKNPSLPESGRPYYMREVKPGQHRAGKTFWQILRDEFYADNAFTVTLVAILLALFFGGVLMIIGDANARAQWGYFLYQPLTTLETSWDLVSEAYLAMF